MIELLSNPNTWIAFLTLSALEIILGIDNIVFISILANRLPQGMRNKVRQFGLLLALVSRILLLLSLSWVMGLTEPLIVIFTHPLSGRDLILLFGGLFLIWKSAMEIFESVEADGEKPTEASSNAPPSKSLLLFWVTVAQIGILDIVFSLDSVITALGMVDDLRIMIAAVLMSVLIMLIAAKPIGEFVLRHPSIKVLALSFLTMIGFVLICEALGVHIPKGYIYVAMGFALVVELINIKSRSKKNQPR